MGGDSGGDVRDHIPLEQGLRRAPGAGKSSVVWVRDHIPLEQGLRQPIHQWQMQEP